MSKYPETNKAQDPALRFKHEKKQNPINNEQIFKIQYQRITYDSIYQAL